MILRFLFPVARRLPMPVQDRLRKLWEGLHAVGLGRLRWGTKLRLLRSYGVKVRWRPLVAARFVLLDPELDNFTYEIANEGELAEFVAAATDRDRREIERYIAEPRVDRTLTDALARRLRGRLSRKRKPHFGRRLGWYALVRALKPELVVETGIHDGLGSALLLRALERNAEDGAPGRLISIDFNPAAGWLVPDALRERWTPTYESTFTGLPGALDGLKVGMIVHDSEHSYECENFEFKTALDHAASRIALVSDNAHATSALRDVCASLGIEYRFFRERPAGHFYPGAGIGLGVLDRPMAGGRTTAPEQAPQNASG